MKRITYKAVLVLVLLTQVALFYPREVEAQSHASVQVIVRGRRPICRIGQRSRFCAAPARRIVRGAARGVGRGIGFVADNGVLGVGALALRGAGRLGGLILFGRRFRI